VARIELERCCDEASALARESELLRSLRPPFNRAGTWPGVPKHLLWRACDQGLELAINSEPADGWRTGPHPRPGMVFVRSALARLLWCGIWPQHGYAALPAGWCRGRADEVLLIRCQGAMAEAVARAQAALEAWCAGQTAQLAEWVRQRNRNAGPFEAAALEADLERACGV